MKLLWLILLYMFFVNVPKCDSKSFVLMVDRTINLQTEWETIKTFMLDKIKEINNTQLLGRYDRYSLVTFGTTALIKVETTADISSFATFIGNVTVDNVINPAGSQLYSALFMMSQYVPSFSDVIVITGQLASDFADDSKKAVLEAFNTKKYNLYYFKLTTSGISQNEATQLTAISSVISSSNGNIIRSNVYWLTKILQTIEPMMIGESLTVTPTDATLTQFTVDIVKPYDTLVFIMTSKLQDSTFQMVVTHSDGKDVLYSKHYAPIIFDSMTKSYKWNNPRPGKLTITNSVSIGALFVSVFAIDSTMKTGIEQTTLITTIEPTTIEKTTTKTTMEQTTTKTTMEQTTKKTTMEHSTKPMEHTTTKPMEHTTKPMEHTTTKPMENTPTKQMENTPTKPMERTPTKPMENTPTKPIENTPTKQMENTPTKPMEQTTKSTDKTTTVEITTTTPLYMNPYYKFLLDLIRKSNMAITITSNWNLMWLCLSGILMILYV